ncbi:MAG: GNAT family N-acetyltransferase [Candidatus Cyclonatronum sp.]|uniref:GNAT family N-acetyltransferase n=1 Tax=Cyclonatronum sp. TaxID=3024185 RepID=UPI0025C59E30|nr:GNAT family N-acetyltransferase [Cyclonatronum sp.]MCH8486849.1 GNAT family N-acetyltransferase [Cyclonatronum sp.]
MITVKPATVFAGVKEVVGPKHPDASVCWCLTYRLPAKENNALTGPARGERVAEMLKAGPIGVLAYDGDEAVGWAAVAPRRETTFDRSRTIPRLDDADVWCVWCIRVKPGHRRKGISHQLLAGAIAFARGEGAAILEGYPLDNAGKVINTTMAYVGTKALFESAGFRQVADTKSVLDGFPRVLMRLNL